MTRGIGQQFFHGTEYRFLEPSRQQQGLPQPPLELDYDRSAPAIPLPPGGQLPVADLALRTAIENRRTLRAYAAQSLTLDELSWLLWCTQGVQKVISRPATLRPVPSAGARHAFETYLLVNKVADVPPGLYRFVAGEHKLVEFDRAPDLAARMTAALYGQDMVQESAATFLWVAVLERMYWRYGERGYRYFLLDAGHVCQNLYLAAEAIDCGACAIGAFHDELVNPLLRLDGENQFLVYSATVGKRKQFTP